MRKFAVIGLGRFGARVARTLAERGAEVIAVDKDERLIAEFKDIVALAVKMDSTDEEALKSQGIDQVDVAIVSIGENFESSVLTTALLKRLGVPTVITRASRTASRIRERILNLIGADRVVLPEEEMGKRLAQNLLVSSILDYIPISQKYSAAEVRASKKFWDKKIGDLKIREKYKVSILEIKKVSGEGKNAKVEKINYLPQANDVIEKGDVLLVIGEEEDIEHLSKEE
ncbi:MAG: TrkA family potassium uptake protein [Candidatus Aerophobetes bacterium]|nr:TrkA family potassium uptake protein [Candidatus Aerophobetes bacterium]